MVVIDPGAFLERFDYARVDADWAVLRVLGRLGATLEAPSGAELLIASAGITGEETVRTAVESWGLERRLLAGDGGVQLLWRASVAVPLAIVAAADSRFALVADGWPELALPAPRLRPLTPHRLTLSPVPGSGRLTFGSARLRAAALATAVAVTTATPAAAFAGVAASTHSSSTAGPAATASLTTSSTPAHTSHPKRQVPTKPARSDSTHSAAEPRATVGTPPHGATPALKLTHLFTDRGHRSPQATAAAALRARSCTASTGGSVSVTADATPGHTARISCPAKDAPATHRQRPSATLQFPATPAKPTTTAPGETTTTPGTTTTTPGGTTTTPAPSSASTPSKPAPGRSGALHQTHTPVPAKHHAASHATGGAPVAPSAGSVTPVGSSNPPTSVPTLSSGPSGAKIPNSWTGTVTANPALTGAVTNLAGLLSDGDRPPSFLIPIYMEAGKKYDVPWEVLAAINAIESDYGRNLNTSSAGAIGWMQFEPSTWRQYGMAVDGHSVPNPYDPRDAIFSAARYLAAAGAAKDVAGAVFSYNHASWYVDEVLSRARAIAGHAQYEHEALEHGNFKVSFATGVKHQPTITYSGGVLSNYDRLIAAANMVSAANFPYLYGGGHEQPARFGPFDCSGSVSYVMQQAGYSVPTTVSGDIPSWHFPAGPGAVTIFYNPVHTFMRIDGRYFGTSGFARGAGGGAGWFDVDKLPAGYLATFKEVHVPGLGTNSFAASSDLVSQVSYAAPKPAPRTQSWSSFQSQVRFWMSSLGPFPKA
ncbi:MAG TPA: lytic murein transglycosylase [Solirubrobacteraceae bacterium]|nr:lytic murein transglycosylase [Solirubrobacteraceae bacterium]